MKYYSIITSESLEHHGIKGQRWGVRRYQNTDGTRTAEGKKRERTGKKEKSPEEIAAKKEKMKKVAKVAGATLTIAACAGIYMANKDAIDGAVKHAIKNIEVQQAFKPLKERAYAEANKEKIMKSPGKLNRYKDYYSENEVKNAITKLNQTRDLHNLQQDKISRGAKYAQAFLLYGTAITSAYALTKSPLVQDAKKANNKKKHS